MTDSLAVNITIISRHDLVDFGIIACGKTVPEVRRLLEYLEDGLVEPEAGLGFAPVSKARPKARPTVCSQQIRAIIGAKKDGYTNGSQTSRDA